ncbi:DUF6777 domain-containing protein [Nocardia sp. NPDC060256]|uniref:DUF6777 domain-containing protein n=1 Tax=unclassified Nocardia TaxID=2637762 RepID=UPI0036623525
MSAAVVMDSAALNGIEADDVRPPHHRRIPSLWQASRKAIFGGAAAALIILVLVGWLITKHVLGYAHWTRSQDTVQLVPASEMGVGPVLPNRPASAGFVAVTPPTVRWRSRPTGDEAALYGGKPKQPIGGGDEMISHFQNDVNAATLVAATLELDQTLRWARGAKLEADNLDDYLRELTSVVLTADTMVRYHVYRNGQFESSPAILQAGTTVMVDTHGVPRLRNLSGSPLTVLDQLDPTQLTYSGSRWQDFDAASVVAVQPSGAAVPTLRLRDLSDPNKSDQVFQRPIGTNGERDYSERVQQSADSDLSGNWILESRQGSVWVGGLTRTSDGFQFVSVDFRPNGKRIMNCQLNGGLSRPSTLTCRSTWPVPTGTQSMALAFAGQLDPTTSQWDGRKRFRFTGDPTDESELQEHVTLRPE